MFGVGKVGGVGENGVGYVECMGFFSYYFVKGGFGVGEVFGDCDGGVIGGEYDYVENGFFDCDCFVCVECVFEGIFVFGIG